MKTQNSSSLSILQCKNCRVKKLISLIVVTAIIASMCIPVFADSGINQEEFGFSFTVNPSAQEVSVSQDAIHQIIDRESDFSTVYNQAISDFETMSSMGIDLSTCTPVDILDDGKILYELAYSIGVINYATVSFNDDGYNQIDFYEDEKHDTIVYLPNGDLIVNGALVECSNSDDEVNDPSVMVNYDPAVAPRARYSEYSLDPWGSPSEYTIYVTQKTGSKAPWGVDTIADMTISGVASILANAILSGIGGVVGIMVGVAQLMIENAQTYGMEDAYFSWKLNVYKREGNFPLEVFRKYTGYCYSRRNYTGTSYRHTYYYHNYFS